jgi:integrase
MEETIVKKTRHRRRGQHGSVLKRGEYWTLIYRVKGKQKWEGGFETKGKAQDRLGVVLKSIGDNRYVEKKEISVADFCLDWMEKSKATLKPKTWCFYQSVLAIRILPQFGDSQLRDVNRDAVKDFVWKLESDKKLSRKTVKNAVALLHGLFEEALDRELIASNPAHKIKLHGESEPEERIVPKPDEVSRTFAKLSATYQALLITAATTGLRRAELLGLKWDDVDRAQGAIHVRRSLQRLKRSILDAQEFRNVERIGSTALALVPPKSRKSAFSVLSHQINRLFSDPQSDPE